LRRAAWAFVAVLFVVRHDFWWWSDRTVVLGCLPVGLAWHVLVSLLAALAWFAVVRRAWPRELDDPAGSRGP
jgi:hypothetical protein